MEVKYLLPSNDFVLKNQISGNLNETEASYYIFHDITMLSARGRLAIRLIDKRVTYWRLKSMQIS